MFKLFPQDSTTLRTSCRRCSARARWGCPGRCPWARWAPPRSSPTASSSTPSSPHTRRTPAPWTARPNCTALPLGKRYFNNVCMITLFLILLQSLRRHLHLVWPAASKTPPESTLQCQGVPGRCPLGHHREVSPQRLQTLRLHPHRVAGQGKLPLPAQGLPLHHLRERGRGDRPPLPVHPGLQLQRGILVLQNLQVSLYCFKRQVGVCI